MALWQGQSWQKIFILSISVLTGLVVGCDRPITPSSKPNNLKQPEASATGEIPSAVEPVAQRPKDHANPKTTSNDVYTVTRIYDGDTVEAFQNGETIKVRLACIDAPESDQLPHGPASKNQLSSLLPGQVRLNAVDQDRYGRLVAEVYTLDGNFINLQMIESGHAVVYDQYLDSCGDNASILLAAELQAQSSELGVWSDPAFVMPWDYRQGVRSPDEPSGAALPLKPEPPPNSDSATANLPACISGDCDCGDFSRWEQAQNVLNSSPGDPHGLDGDGDGIACESLQ